ncbi:pantetheinase-like [Sycon ciliatum]|uniref:pantetheinase-like n=1 Tax=Sycon ciliatum TaxID=27933 RepID=UPI0020AA4D23|eukprot:scpid69898/ scgid29057/ Pantetheinase; Pantetheine hydrolase; Tiff66; Vascular non-inflammatory molecule 1
MALGSICLLYACLSATFIAATASSREHNVVAVGEGGGGIKYRAAAYEHEPHQGLPVSRSGALDIMMQNLADFESATEAFSRAGTAQIIVFPEDGITGLLVSKMEFYAEPMPNLTRIVRQRVVPCAEAESATATPVLRRLSCMAIKYGTVVVANMADKDVATGHLYNTDVAFDTDGRLLMKYHKEHLFFEQQFTPGSAHPEHAPVFRTSFGVTFGLCTCYDILFPAPCQQNVLAHGATELAFPTAWMNAGPLLYSTGIQQSFSAMLGVNVIAANAHLPAFRFTGSGVYAAGGNPLQTYIERAGDPSISAKLLSADLVSGQARHSAVAERLEPLPLVAMDSTTAERFKAETPYKYEFLSRHASSLEVCEGAFCCLVTYQFDNATISSGLFGEHFALGVFNGTKPRQPVTFWAQTCAVIKCFDGLVSSCSNSSPTATVQSRFTHLSVSARFDKSVDETRLYPVVMTSGASLVDMATDVAVRRAAENVWSLRIKSPLAVSAVGFFAHPALTAR